MGLSIDKEKIMKKLKFKNIIYTLIFATTVSNVSIAKPLNETEKEREVVNYISLFEYLFNEEEHRSESKKPNDKNNNNYFKIRVPTIRPTS
jgi:hypothetical protein